jgi:serralysin
MENVFANVEHVANLHFVQLTGASDDDALIRISKAQLSNAEAWAYYPSSAPEGGDAWFQKTPAPEPGLSYGDASLMPGGYSYTVFLHEIGHSLGLKHSFEGGKNGTVPRDSLEYTVMSYSSFEKAATWFADEGNYPQALMQYDIAALQHMYGANTTYNSGDTTYSWAPGSGTTFIDRVAAISPASNKIFLTIWDGGGNDTYDLSEYTTGVKIDLRPGAWTLTSVEQLADLDGNDRDGNSQNDLADGNIANALLNADPNTDRYAGLIENAEGGSGADLFYASVAANEFTGNGGADTFVWASRDDLLNLPDTIDDVVMDFQTQVDVIKLQGIAGGVHYAGFDERTGEVWFDLGYNGFVEDQIDAIIKLDGRRVAFNPDFDLVIV